MSRRDKLSLDEFATAPRKRSVAPAPEVLPERMDGNPSSPIEATDFSTGDQTDEVALQRQDARKALRQVKRDRMKGASHFVNVNLDRETKRRLKLASFTAETSMQAIMEKAIRAYLDENGF